MNEDTKQEIQRKPNSTKNYSLIGHGVILPVTKTEGQRLEEGNGNWMYASNKEERRQTE